MSSLRVLSPCTQDFSAMRGDGATRFCDVCRKEVHHLETVADAEQLLARARAANEARVCVRFRHDGTGRALLRAAVVAGAVGVAACSAADPTQTVQLGPIPPPPVGISVMTDAGEDLYMLGDISVDDEPQARPHCRVGPDGKPLRPTR
jgi:hypothetical protein